ncbi:MAG: hypothetical protein CMF74_12635 [Maricaulis sp.]|nr:hypothetical protein [Maricaulis sp.]
MIDTRKYEGHTPAPWREQVDTDGKTEFDEYGSVWKGKDVIALVDDQACDEMFPDADLNLIADAPLLLEEVKRLREGIGKVADNMTKLLETYAYLGYEEVADWIGGFIKDMRELNQ